jgi:hypothetical protein
MIGFAFAVWPALPRMHARARGKVTVKVVEIFGNDTMTIMEVTVPSAPKRVHLVGAKDGQLKKQKENPFPPLPAAAAGRGAIRYTKANPISPKLNSPNHALEPIDFARLLRQTTTSSRSGKSWAACLLPTSRKKLVLNSSSSISKSTGARCCHFAAEFAKRCIWQLDTNSYPQRWINSKVLSRREARDKQYEHVLYFT